MKLFIHLSNLRCVPFRKIVISIPPRKLSTSFRRMPKFRFSLGILLNMRCILSFYLFFIFFWQKSPFSIPTCSSSSENKSSFSLPSSSISLPFCMSSFKTVPFEFSHHRTWSHIFHHYLNGYSKVDVEFRVKESERFYLLASSDT